MSKLPLPGAARLTLALLAAIPAVMAFPWPSTRDRWVLGVAVATLVVLLGWWRGLHLTTLLRRRAAMLRHRGGAHTDRRPGPDARATALLRVVSPTAGPDVLPLPLIAGYLDRYGLHADAVRVTSRETGSRRDTWIGLTLSAAANLAALRGRSPRIPLAETAEVAARRLGDQLREKGWEAASVGPDDVPQLVGAGERETWRALTGGTGEHLVAYRISVDDTLSDTLARIPACGALETWTVVEIGGQAGQPCIAAGCAFRTAGPPSGDSPLPGLIPQHGRQRAALQALHPLSGTALDGRTETDAGDIASLRWPAAGPAAAASASRT